MRSGCCDDIRAAARLLHPEATKKERANCGGKAPARFLRFLQSAGRSGHSAPLAGAGGFLSFFFVLGPPGLAPLIKIVSCRLPIFGFPLSLVSRIVAVVRQQ